MIYDIIKSDKDGVFQIVCGGESHKIEFDNEEQKNMFLEFVDCKNDKYSSLVKKFLKKYDKQFVYSFFNELKESGLFYFDTEDNFKEGAFF